MAEQRLRQKYADEVVPALSERFGYSSPMAVPRVLAVKLNMGIGKLALAKQEESDKDRKKAKKKAKGAQDKAPQQKGEQGGTQKRGAVNKKVVEDAERELTAIAGQKPVKTLSRKPIAGFNLRAGVPVGCAVTLRGVRMWEFLDRLISISLPRVRDFQGVPPKFDGRGNYTLGIREHTIFPEIDYTKVDKMKGLNVTVVTTARTDGEGLELLRLLGMPFRS